MARLVAIKDDTFCRLFCNTIDQWVSPLLTREKMVEYLTNEWPEKFTKKQIEQMVFKVGYTKEDFDYENKWWSYKECQKAHKLQTKDDKPPSTAKTVYLVTVKIDRKTEILAFRTKKDYANFISKMDLMGVEHKTAIVNNVAFRN